MQPTVIQCKCAFEYFQKVESMGRRNWIYRGHSRYSDDLLDDNDWKLESSLHRFLKQHKGKILKATSWYPREKALLNRFAGSAHIHLSHLPEKTDRLGWLALMQHYGSPTRLIDFTFSPAAALYFAIREVQKGSGPFSIHALHLDTVRGRAKVAREKSEKYKDRTPPLNPSSDEYGIGRSASTVDFIGFFDGSMLNPRQEAQDGLFLVPSKIDLNVENWLSENLEPVKTIKPFDTPWVEFVFNNEKDDYYKIVNQLIQVGVTPKKLFPGLEGISEATKFAWLEVAKNLEPYELNQVL